MNIFEDLKIKEEKLHTKYKLIRDNLQLTGEQEILRDWVGGFEDRDNKIVKEFIDEDLGSSHYYVYKKLIG